MVHLRCQPNGKASVQAGIRCSDFQGERVAVVMGMDGVDGVHGLMPSKFRESIHSSLSATHILFASQKALDPFELICVNDQVRNRQHSHI